MKQLGVLLDTKLTFKEHVRQAAVKAEKKMSTLAGLMPNTKGPKSSKRKLLAGSIQSVVLHAAPVWCQALKVQNTVNPLKSIERVLGIRVSSCYRTISREAIEVISGLPPIDLLTCECLQIYESYLYISIRKGISYKYVTNTLSLCLANLSPPSFSKITFIIFPLLDF